MNKLKRWPVVGCVVMAAVVSGCGNSGKSSSSTSLRLVNATTHASLELLVNSSMAIPATATDKVSDSASPSSGTVTLQINDEKTVTPLAISIVPLTGGSHYTVVAYESGGALKMATLTEDFTAPASGAQMRFYDAATDAGQLDIYVTTDLLTPWSALVQQLGTPASLVTKAATITANTAPASSGFGLFAAGTYRVFVTGLGTPTDLRNGLAGTTVTLANLQTATVLLTPTSTLGGVLVNGSTVIQQVARGYSAWRNTTARVRLVAAVSGNAKVDATAAGSTPIDASTSPTVGNYAIVPAVGVLTVNVNGVAVTAPTTPPLVAGGDATLLVYGDPGAARASLITDDNRRPSASGTIKLRLVNGVTGTPGPLKMSAGFSQGDDVAAGMASGYLSVAGSTALQIDVTSPLKPNFFPRSALNLGSDKVYTLFMLGDFAAPIGTPIKDSKDY